MKKKRKINLFRITLFILILTIACVATKDQIIDEKIKDSKEEHSSDYYFRKGNKELKQERTEQAIEFYSKGIDIDKSNWKIFLSRGIAYFKIDEYDKSWSDFMRVLHLNPGNRTSKKWLGKIHFMRGNFDEAYSNFIELGRENFTTEDDLKFYKLVRDSAYRYHLSEAENAIKLRDHEKSIHEFKTCRWIKPDDPEPTCRLAELYLNNNEPWVSYKILESYTGAENPCILYFEVLTNYELADQDSAIEKINGLKQKYPESDYIQKLMDRFQSVSKNKITVLYNEISRSSSLTKGELAFLIAIKILPQLHFTKDESIVVTDIGDSSLKEYIYLVINTDLMSLYPNHTFKPSKIIIRREFVIIVEHLMKKSGINPRDYIGLEPYINCSDLTVESIYYQPAQDLLRMGFIDLFNDNTFRSEETITGLEAVSCLDKLRRILLKR